VNSLLRQGRIVYICTNGVFYGKKMKDYTSRDLFSSARAEKSKKLLDQKLISEKDAGDDFAKGKTDVRPVIAPSKWTY